MGILKLLSKGITLDLTSTPLQGHPMSIDIGTPFSWVGPGHAGRGYGKSSGGRDALAVSLREED